MTDRSNDRPGPWVMSELVRTQNGSLFWFPFYPTYDRFSRNDVLVEPRWFLIGKAWKTCFGMFLHFAVATHKKEFLYRGHVTFFLEFCWCTHVFSFFQLSGSCKFFAFEYYTSNSNSKDGASRHHHRAVARRIFKTFFCWIWHKDHKKELPTFIVKSEILTFCEAGCIGGFCERYCFEVVWGAWRFSQLRKFFGFWDIQFVPRHFLGHWTSYPTSMLCYTSHLQHQTLQPKRWSWYLQAFSMYWTRTSYPRSWEGRL